MRICEIAKFTRYFSFTVNMLLGIHRPNTPSTLLDREEGQQRRRHHKGFTLINISSALNLRPSAVVIRHELLESVSIASDLFTLLQLPRFVIPHPCESNLHCQMNRVTRRPVFLVL